MSHDVSALSKGYPWQFGFMIAQLHPLHRISQPSWQSISAASVKWTGEIDRFQSAGRKLLGRIVFPFGYWDVFNITGVKQCTFRWLISHDSAQKEMVLISLIIHHLIMITCISYAIIFTLALPILINIASLQTCVIRVTDSIRHCKTDYSGIEWSNIYTFWY